MKAIFTSLLLLSFSSVGAQKLTLKDAEKRALEQSPRLKASEQESIAAASGSSASSARLWPRLTFDAGVRYLTTVPSVAVGPSTIKLGDNLNYSVGPTLSYTLFDAGAARSLWKSLESLAEAKQEERILARRMLLSATRVAYAQAQIAQHELNLVEQSLALATSQQKDVSRRFQAGAASRFDFLGAQRELSTYEVRLAASRGELRAAIQELASYVGDLGDPLSLTLDPLETSADSVKDTSLTPPGALHPQLKAQEKIAESAELGAKSSSALHWPTVQIAAKTSIDYPNGAVLEPIHQNTLSLNFSLPIFEGGQISSASEQKRAEALSARYRREQTERELKRDWEKAKARLQGLLDQRKSAAEAVTQSEALAQLSTRSYKAGQISLLDVQAMHLKLLEARVQKAKIDGQLLIQFSWMRSLSNSEETL